MEDFQGLGVNVQVHTRFYRVIFFFKKKAQRSFFWTELSKKYTVFLIEAQKPLQKKNPGKKEGCTSQHDRLLYTLIS